MSGSRIALMVTCVVVAGFGIWFALAKWDQANKVASIASALGAIAAVGVAVWATLRSSSGAGGPMSRIRASGTGRATALGTGSSAVSGVRGTAGESGPIKVRNTGDAEAGKGGSAVSGVRLD
jgi:hypothetical protein